MPAAGGRGHAFALFLCAEDRVFGGFCDAELHDALRRDLDRLAGRRVATHTRLAVHQYELAEARQREGVLGALVGERGELLEVLRRSLLGEARLLREALRDLRF